MTTEIAGVEFAGLENDGLETATHLVTKTNAMLCQVTQISLH